MRSVAPPGKGARIFVKDEAANPSGSFKDRRASLSIHEAQRRGYPGVAAATSGNYGAAVASQAAKAGLRCIIVQEAFDSRGIAQPEIAEKTRACEAYGAEVIRLSVGPELFYVFLRMLKETGYFNASLYTPYSILGIETLGLRGRRRKPAREPGASPTWSSPPTPAAATSPARPAACAAPAPSTPSRRGQCRPLRAPHGLRP